MLLALNTDAAHVGSSTSLQHQHSLPGCAQGSMGATPRTFPVGPDEGQDHSLLLSALEAINRLNLKLRVLAGEALPEQIHLK